MASTSPWRKIIAVLFLVGISLITTLFLLEAGVRLLHLAPPAESAGWFWRSPDPETGWSDQPGATGRWFNPRYEYDVDVSINSQGLRDVERPTVEKPSDTFRILLLGDSYVEGLRVPLEQTFGKVLEAQLNTHAPAKLRFEVIPAGVSGWGTDQQLLWFRKHGAAYQPDLVLLAFYPGNDFQNNAEALEVANMGRVMKPFFHLENGELALSNYPFDPAQLPQTQAKKTESASTATDVPPNTARAQWLKQHSALVRLITPMFATATPGLSRKLVQWGLIEPGQAADDVPADYVPVAYGVYRQPAAAEWEQSFTLTEALLRELQREVTTAGATFAVVSTTAPEQVYPDRWQQQLEQNPTMQRSSWDTEQPNQVLRQIVDSLDVPYLDLLPIFRDHAQDSQPPLHLIHDGHWTPEGERLAGESLDEFLRAQGLVPAGVRSTPAP